MRKRTTYNQLLFDKGINVLRRERIVFSTNGVGIAGERWKKLTYLTAYRKNNQNLTSEMKKNSRKQYSHSEVDKDFFANRA